MDLASRDGQIDAFEDLFAPILKLDVQILDFQHVFGSYSTVTAVPEADTISMLLMTS